MRGKARFITAVFMGTLLGGWAWTVAAAPAKPSVAPAPAKTTAKPVAAPTAAKTAVKTISLDFRDADIDQVLKAYCLASGLTVVKDPSVKGTITIIASGRMTLDQAFDVLGSMLAFRGYALKRTDRLLTVLPVARASEPGVVVAGGKGSEAAYANGRIITQVITLKRTNAQELKKELAPLLSENAQIMVSTQTNTLIVTDFSENVQQLSEIVQELEKTGGITIQGNEKGNSNAEGKNNKTAASQTDIIFVKYANATDLARSLTTLFTTNNNGGGNNRNGNQNANNIPFEQRLLGGGTAVQQAGSTMIIPMPVQTPRNAQGANTGTPAGQQMGFLGSMDPAALAQLGSIAQAVRSNNNQAAATVPTRIVADSYSNSLIVTGPQEAITTIRSIVAAVDQEGAANITYVYRVRYGRAVDLSNTVLTLFGTTANYRSTAQSTVLQNNGNMASAAVQSTGGAATTANANRQQATTGTATANNNRNNQNPAAQLLQAVMGGNNKNNQNNANRNAATAGRPRVTADLKVVPDEPTNTIIITGPKEVVGEMTDLLKKIDVPPPQVHIEAIIAEVSLDQGSKLGVSWESLAKGNPNMAWSTLTWGADMGSGLKSQIIAGGIKAILETIRNDSRFNVLSTPSIMTVNNSQATMYVGKQVPFVTDTTSKDGVVQSTYTYKPVGVTLQVFPRITESGYISLDIYQDSSEAVTNSSTGAPPVISSRNAKTSVMVQHDETVVIGGIIREDKTQTVRKLPLLGDIPLIGALFRRKEEVTSKTELIIFITPQIVRGPDDVGAISKDIQGTLSESMRDTIILPRPVPTLSQEEIGEKLEEEIAKEQEAAAKAATLEATVAPPPSSSPAPVVPTPAAAPSAASTQTVQDGSGTGTGTTDGTAQPAPVGGTRPRRRTP